MGSGSRLLIATALSLVAAVGLVKCSTSKAEAASPHAIVQGDSLTVGAAANGLACSYTASVGRSVRQLIRASITAESLILLGANDDPKSPVVRQAMAYAASVGARWATIYLPGRPQQTQAFNKLLRSYGLGKPDWATTAANLPTSLWAKDGVHFKPNGYEMLATFINESC